MISRLIARSMSYVTAAMLALTGMYVSAAQLTINPSRPDINSGIGGDNTIYQGTDPNTAENYELNSSGACEDVFAGTTNDGFARRALLQFDIGGSVPAGSTVNSVTLTMVVNRSGDNQDATMTLHPVSRTWGEGTVGCGPPGAAARATRPLPAMRPGSTPSSAA